MSFKKIAYTFGIFFICCFTVQAQKTKNYEKEIQAVQSGIDQAIDARLAIANYWANNWVFPLNNRQAGLAYPEYFKSDVVSSIAIGASGTITITFHSKKFPAINGYNIILQAMAPRKAGAGKSALAWNCLMGTLPIKFRPQQCQYPGK